MVDLVQGLSAETTVDDPAWELVFNDATPEEYEVGDRMILVLAYSTVEDTLGAAIEGWDEIIFQSMTGLGWRVLVRLVTQELIDGDEELPSWSSLDETPATLPHALLLVVRPLPAIVPATTGYWYGINSESASLAVVGPKLPSPRADDLVVECGWSLIDAEPSVSGYVVEGSTLDAPFMFGKRYAGAGGGWIFGLIVPGGYGTPTVGHADEWVVAIDAESDTRALTFVLRTSPVPTPSGARADASPGRIGLTGSGAGTGSGAFAGDEDGNSKSGLG